MILNNFVSGSLTFTSFHYVHVNYSCRIILILLLTMFCVVLGTLQYLILLLTMFCVVLGTLQYQLVATDDEGDTIEFYLIENYTYTIATPTLSKDGL